GGLAAGEPLPGAARKKSLEAIAAALGATALLEVVICDYSLESELVRAGNGALMKSLYLQLHRRSEAKWEAAMEQTGSAQAAAIQSLFETTRKGDFAQLLAEAISDGNQFVVPQYIAQAINAIVQ